MAIEQLEADVFPPLNKAYVIAKLKEALEQSTQEPTISVVNLIEMLKQDYSSDINWLEIVKLVTNQFADNRNMVKPIAYMGISQDGQPNKFRLNKFWGAIPLYTHPASQPAQEPVAWTKQSELDKTTTLRNPIVMWKNQYTSIENNVPLYTHPAPSWQGLDEYRHLKWCVEQYRDCVGFEQKSSKFQSVCEALDEVDAIEQALKEKNT